MNNRGFTLIELLVVIAIIALLASILFPVFNQAREKARQTTCASNLKQIYLAISMYASDNDGYFPSGWQYYTYSGGYPYVGEWVWKTGLYPAYASSKEIFFCPGTSNGLQRARIFYKNLGLLSNRIFLLARLRRQVGRGGTIWVLSQLYGGLGRPSRLSCTFGAGQGG